MAYSIPMEIYNDTVDTGHYNVNDFIKAENNVRDGKNEYFSVLGYQDTVEDEAARIYRKRVKNFSTTIKRYCGCCGQLISSRSSFDIPKHERGVQYYK